jgi:hypothetical protein
MGQLSEETTVLLFVAVVFGALYFANRALGVGPGFFRLWLVSRQDHPREFAITQGVTLGIAAILFAIVGVRIWGEAL